MFLGCFISPAPSITFSIINSSSLALLWSHIGPALTSINARSLATLLGCPLGFALFNWRGLDVCRCLISPALELCHVIKPCLAHDYFPFLYPSCDRLCSMRGKIAQADPRRRSARARSRSSLP